MKGTLRKFVLSLIVVAIFAFALVQTPPVSCTIDSASKQETAMSLMQNVVELDLAKYDVKLVSQLNSSLDENVSTLLYRLKSNESTVEFLYAYRNNNFSCFIHPIEGSPVFTRPTLDTLGLAKRVLNNYQSESRASYIQPLLNMLNNVTELKPSSVADNDVKLTVIIKDYQYIEWMKTANGIYNMYDRIALIFRNGALETFGDYWNSYPVGSAAVNVSEGQAIGLAKERVKTYSYDTDPVVSNLTVNDKSNWTHAELSMQPRGGVLFPQWEVYLPLDHVYPGMVTSVEVKLWADTGEISYIHESSVGGVAMEDSSNAAAQTPPPPSSTPDNSQPLIQQNTGISQIAYVEIAASAAVTITVIATVAFAVKKKKH